MRTREFELKNQLSQRDWLKITSDLVLEQGVDYDLVVSSSKSSLQMQDLKDQNEKPIDRAQELFAKD